MLLQQFLGNLGGTVTGTGGGVTSRDIDKLNKTLTDLKDEVKALRRTNEKILAELGQIRAKDTNPPKTGEGGGGGGGTMFDDRTPNLKAPTGDAVAKLVAEAKAVRAAPNAPATASNSEPTPKAATGATLVKEKSVAELLAEAKAVRAANGAAVANGTAPKTGIAVASNNR